MDTSKENMSDLIHRFIFDSYNIRGEMVKLSKSSQEMIKAHNYPPIIANMMQQAAAINVLLATTLKFEGRVSIQLQTSGDLKVLVVQCSHQLGYRGLARYNEDADYSNTSFRDLTRDGQLCITIEPLKGKRYQGVVSLDGDNLAECIESYFNQSEQLQTRIWLFNNESQVCGLLLQALPDMVDDASFFHLEHLASTVQTEEALLVDSETLLHRLFHQESISNLAVDPVTFQCDCSEQKMLSSVCLLAEDEIAEILESEGKISVSCEFCMNQYDFTEIDLKEYKAVEGNETQH